MRYCLFCREAFENDVIACPYCGDTLVDRLSEPGGEEAAEAGGVEPVGEARSTEGPLIQVAIVTGEADLRAAVEVFKEANAYFEIEEVDRAEAQAGIVGGRAWRLLVPADEANAAFMRLVALAPQIFPPAVREHFEEEEETDERAEACAETVDRLVDALEAEEGEAGADFAKTVIEALSCDDADELARAKYALASHAAEVAPLLGEIAAEAAATGGEGAEKVLYNAADVLDASGYTGALASVEALYESPVPQVRSRAAWAAGRLGGDEAVDGLIGLLGDPDEDVRYEASESIWRLTGLDFEFDSDADPAEQAENVEAIRRLWLRSRGFTSVRSKRRVKDFLGGLGRAVEGEEE